MKAEERGDRGCEPTEERRDPRHHTRITSNSFRSAPPPPARHLVPIPFANVEAPNTYRLTSSRITGLLSTTVGFLVDGQQFIHCLYFGLLFQYHDKASCNSLFYHYDPSIPPQSTETGCYLYSPTNSRTGNGHRRFSCFRS